MLGDHIGRTTTSPASRPRRSRSCPARLVVRAPAEAREPGCREPWMKKVTAGCAREPTGSAKGPRCSRAAPRAASGQFLGKVRVSPTRNGTKGVDPG